MSQVRVKENTKFSLLHKCELHTENDEDLLPVPSPYGDAMYRWIYKFRTLYTIAKNRTSRQFFRSHAAFYREKVRHLTKKKYRCIIHPMSNFALRYHIFMSFMWFVCIVVPPYMGSFLAKRIFWDRALAGNLGWICFILVIQVLLLCDLLIRFRTGYIVHKTREVVLEPRRIVIHYLKTYFVFDALPLLCTVISGIFYNYMTYRSKLIVSQSFLLRLVRIRSMSNGFMSVLRCFGVDKSIRTTIIIYLHWIIYIHWWTCFLKLINVVRDEYGISYNGSWIHDVISNRRRIELTDEGDLVVPQELPKHIEYFHYFSLVLCHFLGAGVGYFKTTDSFDMMAFAILLITSLMIYLWSLAILLQTFGMVNMSESRYDEILSQAEEYMVTKRFPTKLRKRISQYYDYKFDKKYFSERKILNTLSEHLQMEILLFSCRYMMDRVYLFKGLSRAAVGCILALLKQEIYLPNDVIMRADDESGTLYFILYGTCGVTLLTGKEAMHIEDGSHFGENRDFSRNVTHDFLYMIVALEPCEVYSLSQEDIQYCCKHYPEVAVKIESMLVSKSRHYSNILAKATSEDEAISATDIIEELRKGKIIDHGRARWMPLDTKYNM